MTKRLFQSLFQSLVGRVMLALLGAFALVALVLLWQDYRTAREHVQQGQQQRQVAQAILESLPADNEQEATLIVAAAERQFNALRAQSASTLGHDPGRLILRLETQNRRLVYASPQPDGAPTYWHVTVVSPQWRVHLLEPALTEQQILLLLLQDLWPSLLAAFPLVVLPLWWVVAGALRPLRRLAADVAARSEQDLAPLHLPGKGADYVELRPLIGAFNQLLTRAQDGIDRERAFIQDAAHELRTPLAVVNAQAHNLTQASSPAQRTEAQHALEAAVARASHLVHQLLTLATLEGSGQNPVQTLDLVAYARNLLISAASTAEAKGMDVGLDSPEHLVAQIDGVAFHSILENLLNNAIAHGRVGGRVDISLSSTDKQIRLAVTDDGPGIPDAERSRLLQRFQRGNTQARGSGLGLAIVHQAAQRMDAELSMGPGLNGTGITFTLHFPSHEAIHSSSHFGTPRDMRPPL